ncbi:MAG TPA: glucosaminidase domain-containing protein [Chloroflexota bacterium]
MGSTLSIGVANAVHRWRRHILHLAACGAVIASGGTSLLVARAPAAAPPGADVRPADDIQAMVPLAVLPPVPLPPSDTVDEPRQVTSAAEDAPALSVTPRSYVVQAGDSVRTIAQQFGVTNETIIWENDLTDPDYLTVGQSLHILPFTGLIHEVRPGDTLASVANSYDAVIKDVVNANKLVDPFIIVVGQKLAVPGGYRPLPRKVIPEQPPADTVEAPPGPNDQQAAVMQVPRRSMPTLGNTPQERFIASIAEAAVSSRDQTGVPASVTIAQAILESFWGSSRLAREANNYFGIKAQTRVGSAGVVWFDVWEVIGGRNMMRSEPFRAYNSIAESFVDHGRFFLENGRYSGAMASRDDAQQFAREVNRAGYATDPAYAGKLIALMDRYNLYRFDEV